MLDAHVERMKQQHNERAWLAWHVEALARQKRLPKLSSLYAAPQARLASRVMVPVMEDEVRGWLARAARRR